MSKIDKEEIKEFLHQLLCSKGYTIVCIGSELREDDRAGLILCDKLIASGIHVIKCPYGLESCIDVIVRENVEKMLLIDTVLVEGSSPGEIVLTRLNSVVENYLVTTHSIPVSLMIKYFQTLGLCREVYVIGIQAKRIGFGLELSREVLEAIDYLSNSIVEIYSSCREDSGVP